MTTRKAREFWIHKAYTMGWTVHDEPMIAKHELEKSFHVREVLPEPTDEEIERMAVAHANLVSDPEWAEWHGRYASHKAGFRAALKWMKGESE